MLRQNIYSQIPTTEYRVNLSVNRRYILRTISKVPDMSSERRISSLHAKTNLNFGKSFKLDRNNFSTVSEWKTFCENYVLLPFRSAGGVMCDILNELVSVATCCELHTA
jgi:hypothetical protein